MSIVLSYPWWFLVFCILTGILYAGVLYWKSKAQTSLAKWLFYLITVLRFLVVTTLCFLLLSPFIKKISKKVEKPIVVIVNDNSYSIPLNNDSNFYKVEYPNKIKQFSQSFGDEYEVVNYTFGKDLTENSKLDYNEKVTNISNALDEISLRFINRNIGTIILASDGIYNQGSNPVYASNGMKVPIYTIALGDTILKRDALVTEVNYNSVVFLGNQFPIEAMIQLNKLKGENAQISISQNGKVISTQSKSITSEKQLIPVNFSLEATQPGTQRYRISVTQFNNEATFINNFYDIYVDVIDSRQKILILADAPHPDIAALQQSINTNKNYQSEVGIIGSWNKNLRDYSLVILHQIPSSTNNGAIVITELNKFQIPTLYILGSNTSISNFNTLNTGVKVIGNKNNTDEVLGVVNSNFTLYSITDQLISEINFYPPLIAPYGTSFEVSGSTEVLINRKVGSVKTNYPLVALNNLNKHKIGFILGEGIWKWRLYNYENHRNHDLFNEFVHKMIQYLAVKEDKSFFRVNLAQQFYENETVILFAELYNESYELINDPDVKLNISSDKNVKYNYQFSKINKSYKANLGILPVGEYTYEAITQYKNKPYKKAGKFIVKPIQLEALNTTANHQLLNRLSKNSGGQMFYPRQLNELLEVIKKKEDITSVAYKQKQMKELIYYKWIFFLLLFLLALEWFIRKREGL